MVGVPKLPKCRVPVLKSCRRYRSVRCRYRVCTESYQSVRYRYRGHTEPSRGLWQGTYRSSIPGVRWYVSCRAHPWVHVCSFVCTSNIACTCLLFCLLCFVCSVFVFVFRLRCRFTFFFGSFILLVCFCGKAQPTDTHRSTTTTTTTTANIVF